MLLAEVAITISDNVIAAILSIVATIIITVIGLSARQHQRLSALEKDYKVLEKDYIELKKSLSETLKEIAEDRKLMQASYHALTAELHKIDLKLAQILPLLPKSRNN